MDVFKDLYDLELSRRQQLNGGVPLPAGVLSVLGGLLALMLREFSWSDPSLQAPFVALTSLAGLSFAAAVMFLIRSYWGYDAQYVARADQLHEYFRGLQDHFERHGGGAPADELADSELRRSLRPRFAEAAAYNAQQNDRRSEFLFRANGLLILTLFLTGLSAIPYSLDAISVRNGGTNEQDTETTAAAATSGGSAESIRAVMAGTDAEGTAAAAEEE